jgi:hypothetical protein
MQNAIAAVEAQIGREAAAQQRAARGGVQKRTSKGAGARGGEQKRTSKGAGARGGEQKRTSKGAGARGGEQKRTSKGAGARGGEQKRTSKGAAGAAGDTPPPGEAPGEAPGAAHGPALLLHGFDSLDDCFEVMRQCVAELKHALAGGASHSAPLAAAPGAAGDGKTADGGETPSTAPLAAAPGAAGDGKTADGGETPSTAPLAAAPGPRKSFDCSLEKLALKVLASTLPNSALKNNHVPVDTPRFKPKAREGGNLSRASVSHREIHVALDANNLAMWQPNPRNARFIAATRAFLETQTLLDSADVRVRREGLLHPLLQISSAFVSTLSRPHLIDKIYGHVTTPEKSFGQFLCEIAIRSQPTRDGWIWEFDPEAWNRVGHRIVVGGASSGGKPRIVFERA